MNFRKRHVLHLFFFICFSFYVMSPFCSVGNCFYAEDSSAFTGNSGGSRICVVWELLMSGPFQNGNAESGRSGVHFLIKKARAVLGQNGPERMPVPESVIALPGDHFFTEGYPASPPQTASPSPEDGFHFLSSGLSPPFVSLS
jgi:hypothetical protein